MKRLLLVAAITVLSACAPERVPTTTVSGGHLLAVPETGTRLWLEIDIAKDRFQGSMTNSRGLLEIAVASTTRRCNGDITKDVLTLTCNDKTYRSNLSPAAQGNVLTLASGFTTTSRQGETITLRWGRPTVVDLTMPKEVPLISKSYPLVSAYIDATGQSVISTGHIVIDRQTPAGLTTPFTFTLPGERQMVRCKGITRYPTGKSRVDCTDGTVFTFRVPFKMIRKFAGSMMCLDFGLGPRQGVYAWGKPATKANVLKKLKDC